MSGYERNEADLDLLYRNFESARFADERLIRDEENGRKLVGFGICAVVLDEAGLLLILEHNKTDKVKTSGELAPLQETLKPVGVGLHESPSAALVRSFSKELRIEVNEENGILADNRIESVRVGEWDLGREGDIDLYALGVGILITTDQPENYILSHPTREINRSWFCDIGWFLEQRNTRPGSQEGVKEILGLVSPQTEDSALMHPVVK